MTLRSWRWILGILLGMAPLGTGDVGAYTITYTIGAAGQVPATGTVSEGETYVVPKATLTGLAMMFQPYWNAFEGTTMTIPSGALSSDIAVTVTFSNFDLASGRFSDLEGEKIFLSMDFIVQGQEGGLELKKPMMLTLPLDQEMGFLLQLAGFDGTTSLGLAYWTGSEFVSIPTTQTETELRGELSHLSTIVGRRAMPTGVESFAWGVLKALYSK